jgi:hypothetical protein
MTHALATAPRRLVLTFSNKHSKYNVSVLVRLVIAVLVQSTKTIPFRHSTKFRHRDMQNEKKD